MASKTVGAEKGNDPSSRPHSVPPGFGGSEPEGEEKAEPTEKELQSAALQEEMGRMQDAVLEGEATRKRRYYVEDMSIECQLKEGETREGKTGFLKHFDIDILPGTAMKHNDTSDPAGYLRIYYSDFFNNKELQDKMHTLTLAWKKRRDDLKALFEWVSDMRPRTRSDAYPMLLMLQEMLKTVLSEKYEFHLQALEKANERIDMMDGDHAELRDQIGRLEEELLMSHEKTEQLEESLQLAEEATKAAEVEIKHLQEELQSLTQEVAARELERQKYLKTLHKLQTDLEQKQSDYACIKMRTAAVENGLKARREMVMRWKFTAQELMEEDHMYNSDGEEDDELPQPQDLDAMAVQVSKGAYSLLDHWLMFWQFNHVVNLDAGDCIADMELQYLMQLACEVVSNVTQAENVYVAELILNQEKGGAAQFLKEEEAKEAEGEDGGEGGEEEKARLKKDEKESERAVIEFDETATKVFMYVASTPNNSFLVGTTIPSSSVTHRHFVGEEGTPPPETASEPLQVDLFERWEDFFFFKQGAREKADHRAQYISVPLVDLKGSVCGFLGVDTIHMAGREQEPPELFEPWRVDMLHAVADCLGRALALSHGLAEDYDDMIGPTHFAKKIVEIVAGRSAENFEDEEPAFLQRFPMLSDLATRGCNVFGCFHADLPRKRYFTSDEEFAKEQLEDMKDVRSSLQEAIFAETRMRREIKLMCSLPAPPPETLKVWRTAIVLLGLKGDEVLNTDQSVAWDQIRYMLSEERPAKERMFSIVKDFDPGNPKQLDKANEARYNLASGLTQTVRPKQLMKEGALSVLLYEWTLSVQWTRQLAVMVKEGGLTYYKDTL